MMTEVENAAAVSPSSELKDSVKKAVELNGSVPAKPTENSVSKETKATDDDHSSPLTAAEVKADESSPGKADDKSSPEAKAVQDDEEKKATPRGRKPKAARTPKTPSAESPSRSENRRDRKKPQRFSNALDQMYQQSEERRHVIPKGTGECLKDCPRVLYFLYKVKPDNLKCIHSLMFGRTGRADEVRKNLKEFCGFEFSQDSKEYEKLLMRAQTKKRAELKKSLYILDLDRGGNPDREEMAKRICQFLLKPFDNGKKPPKVLPFQKLKKGKAKAKKARASAGKSDSEPEDSEPESGGSEPEPPSDSDSDHKKKAAKRKPAKRKSSPGKSASKASKRKPKKAKKDESDDDDSLSSDDDDDDNVPLKKLKASPPGDDALKKTVKDVIKTADLEKCTMKDILNKVYQKHSSFDLTHKKDFIKELIRAEL